MKKNSIFPFVIVIFIFISSLTAYAQPIVDIYRDSYLQKKFGTENYQVVLVRMSPVILKFVNALPVYEQTLDLNYYQGIIEREFSRRGFRIIDRKFLYRSIKEQELQSSGLVDETTFITKGKILGIKTIVDITFKLEDFIPGLHLRRATGMTDVPPEGTRYLGDLKVSAIDLETLEKIFVFHCCVQIRGRDSNLYGQTYCYTICIDELFNFLRQ
jgi:hypothetical protein